MHKFLVLGLSSVALATPAFADLTAEQVLADQLNVLTVDGFAQAETTGITPSGNGLTVAGYRILFTDQDGSTATMTLSGAEIVERSDGSVEILYPDTIQVTVTGSDVTDQTDIETLSWSINLTDMSHIVTGDPGDITHRVAFQSAEMGDIQTVPANVLPASLNYDFAITDTNAVIRLADTAPLRRNATLSMGRFFLEMAMPTLAESGEFGDLTRLDAQIEMVGLNGRFGFADTPVPEHTLDMTFDRFSWRQDMAGDDLDNFTLDLSADDFALAYDAALSFDAMEDDFATAILANQRLSAHMSYAAMSMDIDAAGPEGNFRSLSSAGTTNADLNLDKTGFALSMRSDGNQAAISIPYTADFPIDELRYGIGLTEIDLLFPFNAVDRPKPMRMKYIIRDIVMSEEIWALFDPTGRLPRDPANIVIDFAGQVQQSQSFLEMEPGAAPNGTFTGQLNAFDINLAGTELTASGAANMTVEGDAPPEGTAQLDARLTGFNTLLDTLIDMGLLPAEQAMGARMMLGLIARQVQGEDTLTSTIELREDGSIHANGQRLR